MRKGTTDGFFIGESGIYARMFRPHGVDTCPLVILFHGIPGDDQSWDLAYELREEGYAVLLPNYRGSWGSKGDYRIEGIPEDVKTVCNLVFSDEFGDKWGIDQDRIAVIGHSLGGYATASAIRMEPRLKGFILLDPLVKFADEKELQTHKEMWEAFAAPLKNVTAEQLAKGYQWAKENWNPLDSIDYLDDRFFSIVAASGPGGLGVAMQVEAWEKAKTINPESQLWLLSTGHSFVSERPVFRHIVIETILEKL